MKTIKMAFICCAIFLITLSFSYDQVKVLEKTHYPRVNFYQNFTNNNVRLSKSSLLKENNTSRTLTVDNKADQLKNCWLKMYGSSFFQMSSN